MGKSIEHADSERSKRLYVRTYRYAGTQPSNAEFQCCSGPCTKLLLGSSKYAACLMQHDMSPSLLECVLYSVTAHAGFGEAVCWG